MIAGGIELFGLIVALALVALGVYLVRKKKVGRNTITKLFCVGLLVVVICEGISFTIRTYLPGY